MATAMVTQLLLGGLALLVTVVKVVPDGPMLWIVPSAHVAVGAILLAAIVLLTLAAYRRLYAVGRHNGAVATTGAVTS